MKAASFQYVRAESTAHAIDVLGQSAGDAKLIAGGQSLVPMMAMRLARPSLLIDISHLAELQFLELATDYVQIGSGRRQRHVEVDPDVAVCLPILGEALSWVGHVHTRSRGTIGGSLAHADPSAELPLVSIVLGAEFLLLSHSGQRVVEAAQFFRGPLQSAIADDECLLASKWPVWPGGGVGSAFQEVSVRRGDFAIVSAACQLQIDGDGFCRRASFGLGGVDGVPMTFPDLSRQLLGQRISRPTARELAYVAATRCEPGDDIYATATYRLHLATVLLERVLLQAADRGRAAWNFAQ